MNKSQKTSLIGGILLVLAGGLLLATQFVPGFRFWSNFTFSWPWYVIAVGIFLFVLGLLVGAPGMAVPAAIVGGIGCLLYWQNATGNWESWAYAWTLIPGFVGVGTVLTGILGENTRENLRSGFWMILISLVMFAIFSTFLGGMQIFGAYWPVLIILLGVVILLQGLFRRK